MHKTQLINEKKLLESVELLRAIAHPLRLLILNHIYKQKESNVNSIYKSLGLEQSVASQHLRILRDAHLVTTERRGKYIYYQLDTNKLSLIRQAIDKFDREEEE